MDEKEVRREQDIKLYETLIKSAQNYEAKIQNLYYGILVTLGAVIAFLITSFEKMTYIFNQNYWLTMTIIILMIIALVGSFIYVINLMNDYHSNKMNMLRSSTILSEKSDLFPKNMDPYGYKSIWQLQSKRFCIGMIFCFIFVLIIGIFLGYFFHT